MDTEDLSALEEPLLALTGGGFEEFVTVQLVGQSSTELGESCHSDACDRIRAFLCGAAVAHSRLPFQLCLLREKGLDVKTAVRRCAQSSGLFAPSVLSCVASEQPLELLQNLTREAVGTLQGESEEEAVLALAALAKVHPALETEIVPFHTRGDLILDKPLWAISNEGKGVFASEFEEMLLRDEIDIAIHSGKDLPVLLADGLEIIGVLKRDDPRDVLVMPKGKKAEACKIIGTGSLRREQCAAKVFPWAECRLIRGNIQTRLQKLKDGEYDAILLAKAGLDRMGITEADGYAFRVLSPEEFLPAACQGIIVAEGKRELSSFVGAMTHLETQYIFETERAVLRLLGADCSAPVAAFAEMEGEVIRLRAMYGEGHAEGKAPVAARLQLAAEVVGRLRK